jgi:hypothetical protein
VPLRLALRAAAVVGFAAAVKSAVAGSERFVKDLPALAGCSRNHVAGTLGLQKLIRFI